MGRHPHAAQMMAYRAQMPFPFHLDDAEILLDVGLGEVGHPRSLDQDLALYQIETFDQIGPALVKVHGTFVGVREGPLPADLTDPLVRVHVVDREGAAVRGPETGSVRR